MPQTWRQHTHRDKERGHPGGRHAGGEDTQPPTQTPQDTPNTRQADREDSRGSKGRKRGKQEKAQTSQRPQPQVRVYRESAGSAWTGTAPPCDALLSRNLLCVEPGPEAVASAAQRANAAAGATPCCKMVNSFAMIHERRP